MQSMESGLDSISNGPTTEWIDEQHYPGDELDPVVLQLRGPYLHKDVQIFSKLLISLAPRIVEGSQLHPARRVIIEFFNNEDVIDVRMLTTITEVKPQRTYDHKYSKWTVDYYDVHFFVEAID